MAGMFKPRGAFTITPHKVSVCVLLHIYAPPAQSFDDILEPKLVELITQLKVIDGFQNYWLCDHLTRRLSSLSAPDDLFNFFGDLRVSEDPEVVLDPLRQASDELQELEYHELAAEAFYLMAIVYDKLGQLEEREDVAASFKRHVKVLENPQDLEDPFFDML